MIEEALKPIALYLGNLNFIERAGNIVKPLKQNNKNGSTTIPIQNENNPNGYIDFVPDNKIIGLCYFEFEGNEQITQTTFGFKAEAIVRLIVWVNGKRVAPNDKTPYIINILSSIGSHSFATGDNLSGKISISYIGEAKPNNLFNKYTYEKEFNKMFLFPNIYFGLNFRVNYHFARCTKEITIIDNQQNC